jgi:hypothetical protein
MQNPCLGYGKEVADDTAILLPCSGRLAMERRSSGKILYAILNNAL